MTTPQARGSQPRGNAASLHQAESAKLISDFPTPGGIADNPALILSGAFKPAWLHYGSLIEKADPIFAHHFHPGDSNRAVAFTLKHTPDEQAIRMDLWDFAYLTALSLTGGTLLINSNRKGGRAYVRFRRKVERTVYSKRDRGPLPVARVLLDLECNEGATYEDGNSLNLLRSNLRKEYCKLCDHSRQSLEQTQMKASGFNPQFRSLLTELWEQGIREREHEAAYRSRCGRG